MSDLDRYCTIHDRELNVFDVNSEGKLCKRVCAEIGNTIDNPVPVQVVYEGIGETDFTCINQTVVADTIYAITLVNNLSTLEIRHREYGEIEWSLDDATLSCYSTIPCGNSYSKSNLRLTGKTLYIRSSEGGVIEINQWQGG